VGQIDEIKIKSSEYLMETAHSFRVYLKTHLQGVKSKANPNPPPVPKPDVLNIWVAKTFPAWQSCILTALKTHHEVRPAAAGAAEKTSHFRKAKRSRTTRSWRRSSAPSPS
jgi:hypothetical protein